MHPTDVVDERIREDIMPGYAVFVGDGLAALGAVREVEAAPGGLVIDVENAGDFRVPLRAVTKVVEERVVLRWDELEPALQEAIRHTHDAEDFPPAGEGEAELVPPPVDDEEDGLDAGGDVGLRRVSPPDELPGRDAGSEFGAPPSTTSPRRGR